MARKQRATGPTETALERRLRHASRNMTLVEREPTAAEAIEGPEDIPQTVEDDPEAEWVAPIPEDHPADLAYAYSQSLAHRQATDEDIDHLWDWIRQEEDRGAGFLGIRANTYRELIAHMTSWSDTVYALDDADEHIGIVVLQEHPALPNVRTIHLYIKVESRNQLGRLIPQMQQLAVKLYPGVSFAVATEDKRLTRLYEPFGFKTRYFLLWTPEQEEEPA